MPRLKFKMPRRWLSLSQYTSFWTGALIVAVALTLGAMYSSCRSAQERTTQSSAATSSSGKAAEKSGAVAVRTNIGFASRQKFTDHFDKHGHEFGSITKDEYLQLAQELRDRPAGGDVLEAVRADGVVTRFDRASGTFLAFNADGVIRTCFKPNDGEAYFRRQAKRRPRRDDNE